MTKQKIPASLRQNIWIAYVGKKYETKCYVSWCNQTITPFTFEAGHNIPESKGGPTTLENLRPICGGCNKSMGNKYTIQEYSKTFAQPPKSTLWRCCVRAEAS